MVNGLESSLYWLPISGNKPINLAKFRSDSGSGRAAICIHRRGDADLKQAEGKIFTGFLVDILGILFIQYV